jgi:hypothetical protein
MLGLSRILKKVLTASFAQGAILEASTTLPSGLLPVESHADTPIEGSGLHPSDLPSHVEPTTSPRAEHADHAVHAEGEGSGVQPPSEHYHEESSSAVHQQQEETTPAAVQQETTAVPFHPSIAQRQTPTAEGPAADQHESTAGHHEATGNHHEVTSQHEATADQDASATTTYNATSSEHPVMRAAEEDLRHEEPLPDFTASVMENLHGLEEEEEEASTALMDDDSMIELESESLGITDNSMHVVFIVNFTYTIFLSSSFVVS